MKEDRLAGLSGQWGVCAMSDKTRAEFEELFPAPAQSEWRQESNYYCWATMSAAHPHDDLWQAWLAAKEKYEPRWIPVSERLPEIDQYVVWSCDDGHMIFAERDKDDPDGCWEERFTHWAVINPPSTQGGGE